MTPSGRGEPVRIGAGCGRPHEVAQREAGSAQIYVPFDEGCEIIHIASGHDEVLACSDASRGAKGLNRIVRVSISSRKGCDTRRCSRGQHSRTSGRRERRCGGSRKVL